MASLKIGFQTRSITQAGSSAQAGIAGWIHHRFHPPLQRRSARRDHRIDPSPGSIHQRIHQPWPGRGCNMNTDEDEGKNFQKMSLSRLRCYNDFELATPQVRECYFWPQNQTTGTTSTLAPKKKQEKKTYFSSFLINSFKKHASHSENNPLLGL